MPRSLFHVGCPEPETRNLERLRLGIVDTGVNPWHSHVKGSVTGFRIYVGEGGVILEDDDFRDPVGHGTAVAGILREAFPEAELVAVRVFDGTGTTYPSLVARGILRAAAEGCDWVNLSLSVAPSPGSQELLDACSEALAAGCSLVASSRPDRPDGLPAAVPGVFAVLADDSLDFGDVHKDGPHRLRAPGRPRDLGPLPREANLWGHSFACARGLAWLIGQEERARPAGNTKIALP